MKLLYILVLFIANYCYSQVNLKGIIVSSEDGNSLNNVLIYKNGRYISSSKTNGIFNIECEYNSEISFLKTGYDVVKIKISNISSTDLKIILQPSETLIPEVKISNTRISGNLKKDVSQFKNNDTIFKLQKEIGLPKSPEKPRERPPELTRDILLPLLGATICLENVYKVISGDSKKMKRLYKYEDMLEEVKWLKANFNNEYFQNIGIDSNHINEFLQYSLMNNENIKKGIKENNTSKIMLGFEATSTTYKKRIESNVTE